MLCDDASAEGTICYYAAQDIENLFPYIVLRLLRYFYFYLARRRSLISHVPDMDFLLLLYLTRYSIYMHFYKSVN